MRSRRIAGSRFTGAGTLVVLTLVLLCTASVPGDREVKALVLSAALVLLVIGVVVPWCAVRFVSVRASAPRDAVVGQIVDVEVQLAGWARGVEVRALDPAGEWQPAEVPGTVSVPHLSDRRGHFQHVRVELRVTAPLGLFEGRRTHLVTMPRPIDVAPAPLAVRWRASAAPVEATASRPTLAHGGDEVRSVRPYTPGDPARLVHWPSTARAGRLVVREQEPPAAVGQVVLLDLTGLGADTEQAASYAAGAARAVLASGGELVLCTADLDGPKTQRCPNLLVAGRQLARAVPGPPGEPPAGWHVVEVGR